MDYTQELARFAAELTAEDIPVSVLRRTEDLFLDWTASALAGKGAEPVEMIERFAERTGLRPRKIVTVPVLTPMLASHWVGLVTPVPTGWF